MSAIHLHASQVSSIFRAYISNKCELSSFIIFVLVGDGLCIAACLEIIAVCWIVECTNSCPIWSPYLQQYASQRALGVDGNCNNEHFYVVVVNEECRSRTQTY